MCACVCVCFRVCVCGGSSLRRTIIVCFGSDFEGGVRTAAFLAGGFVPEAVRGTVNSKYIHITDW